MPIAPIGPPLPPDPAALQNELLGAFRGDIPPVRVSVMYQLGISLVALVMVLLPLVYVALIAAACYGVYWHAIQDTWLLHVSGGGRTKGMALLVYVAPMVAGAILLLFMVKPLFARPARAGRIRSLTRTSDPRLFAFVDRLCAAVGSPRPRRIDVNCEVNASAGFRRGLWSMLGSDLVLTIGLPLVAGLNLRQFAGILAHEFGHFSQGAGMRLNYVVRTVSFWFTRVVYERDVWDERVKDWAENSDNGIGFVFHLARFFIWLTRKVLWALMMVGHIVSGFLMRQMEFDADRHEARLAGSDSFESTSRQVVALSVATQGAYSDLSDFYREGRLGDDLPRLIVANLAQIPPEVREKIDEMINQSKTGWFDTHPCDRERIAAARRENSPGVFHLEKPASMLFSNFAGLSKNVTWDYYREIFGPAFKPTDMHPLDDLLARQGKEMEANKALGRYFQGAFQVLRPLPIPATRLAAPAEPQKAAAALKQSRQHMLELKSSYDPAFQAFDKADTEGLEADQAAALLRAEFAVQPSAFSVALTNLRAVSDVRFSVQVRQQQAAGPLGDFERAACQRLLGAIQLLSVPQVAARIEDAGGLADEAARILPALCLIHQQTQALIEVRNARAALAVLLSNLQGHEEDRDLISAIRDQMEEVRNRLDRLRSSLCDVAYPFDHAKGQISLGEYALATVPPADNLGAIYEAADELLGKLPSAYARMVGRMVVMAEQVERLLGLEPLPDPAPAQDGST